MPREARIRCVEGAEDEKIVLDINGERRGATLRIEGLTHRMVANPPEPVLDLIEVAAVVYAADAAMPRGGLKDAQMGARWRRRMAFEIPVRDPDLWNSAEVREPLEKTLGLLSDDHYSFTFVERTPEPTRIEFLNLRDADVAVSDVAMFSGGLDSLAGALEDLSVGGRRVALVSHQSSTKLAKAQSAIISELRKRFGAARVLHFPVSVQLGKGTNRESTHRSRSFLFAALGAAVAEMTHVDRVKFHENGVVSLNLPISGQVAGARATRSTHPQALADLGELFSAVLKRPFSVDNPLFWKTKTDVLALIRNAGARDLVRLSRSCGDVRGRTIMHPHCGRCSQCIDRRFAALAADMGDDDPVVDYEIDPLEGARRDVRDREMALGFVRNANAFSSMSLKDFVLSFGEVQRALGALDMTPDAAARRLFELHQRHGLSIRGVLDGRLSDVARGERDVEPDSLIAMIGRERFGGDGPAAITLASATEETKAVNDRNRHWVLRLEDRNGVVEIDGLGLIRGVAAELLHRLAKDHLQALGAGSPAEDHPFVKPSLLSQEWDLGEEVVRRRVNRLRRNVASRCEANGIAPPDINEIVENIPWRGYRLNPDHVRVYREPSEQISTARKDSRPLPRQPTASCE